MKTEKELSNDILEITMNIKKNYPELVTYLKEMPETIPNTEDPEINIKILQEYYDSLNAILQKYSDTHENN